ncbi:hypothetical protein [Acinetobacter sp. KS-LM10]|uniref:hypothetical protein n=1 Tax=Acinetobacter sp. KS-LM10 TaxID=3120518 RepID=UPI0030CD5304
MFAHILKNLKNNLNEPIQSNNHWLNASNTRLESNEKFFQDHHTRNVMWQYLRAALRGDKEAQYKMGLSYLHGDFGLDRNYTQAEKWLNQAACQGHPEAKVALQRALNHLAFS